MKKDQATRTPARKLMKEDLSSITGGEQHLILGCCTQGCCGGGGFVER